MKMNETRRNVIADAMRGIAGLCILLFHLSEPYSWPGRIGAEPVAQLCGHGYLCVEFFLLLMGFMMAQAYDRRWAEGMTLGAFCRRRLIRLHPFVVSGTILGLCLFLTQVAGWTVFDWRLDAAGGGTVAAVFVLSLVMIPYPGMSHLAPFNPCSWTLYYEYIANFIYGLFIRRLNKTTLAALSLIAALWTVSFAMHVDLNALFGTDNALLATVAARTRDSIEIGWGTKPIDYYGGFVRLCFPFFFGLLLARLGWKIRVPRYALALCVTVFLAILFVPMPFGSMYQNGLYELAVLFIVLPTLLMVSAGSEVTNARVAAFWAFLAELSYPVYMSHYPFMRIYNWWVNVHSHAHSAAFCIALGAALYVLMILLGWVLMRYYDARVRTWYNKRNI